MYPVRNSAKAIIVEDGKLLCIRKLDALGAYCILPGGGQEKEETFPEALRRECLEELGAEVRVGKLRHIREYIGKNHELGPADTAHQVEFMFECELLTRPDMALASHLDEGQDSIEWVELTASGNARVFPKVLVERLATACTELYWGDIN